MIASAIKKEYLDYFKDRGHKVIEPASLIPKDDPTTLFNGSGMQPLLPYLLGQTHPSGQRLVNAQPCLRAGDIDEVGDSSHTTSFEMLGNWSLSGAYFKEEELRWFFDFLINVVGLDINRIYTTCFIGSKTENIAKDTTSSKILEAIYREHGINPVVVEIGPATQGDLSGMSGGRIFYYDDAENWWSRGGRISQTPIGDPAGPDVEFFYDFGDENHQSKFGRAHPASDSPRFLEIGNSVFMSYRRTDSGFVLLDKPNVDFGAGLERLEAASNDQPDVFQGSLLKPLINCLEESISYNQDQNRYLSRPQSMRIVADHFRAACWLAANGVTPSNKQQGYVMRRFIRRAFRVSYDLNIRTESNCFSNLSQAVIDIYQDDYPEFRQQSEFIKTVINQEVETFRQRLKAGLRAFAKLTRHGGIDGQIFFKLYDTYGFPFELSFEEAKHHKLAIDKSSEDQFLELMKQQQERSRIAKGQFKGGLADDNQETVYHHTATHLLYRALRNVLGEEVVQMGSNVTAERLRFDFSHPRKVSKEELDEIEKIVNDQIKANLPVSYQDQDTDQALASGALGAFGDKYGQTVRVYRIGDFSKEICGGPHVNQTGELASDGRSFAILKEKSSAAGVRRIKAALVKSD